MTDGEDVKTPISWGDVGLVSLGRGQFMRDESTPVRGAGALGKPALSSTGVHTDAHFPAPHARRLGYVSDMGSGVSPVGRPVFSYTHTHTDEHSPRQPVFNPDVSSSDLGNLITQLAHEIGENIASQLKRSVSSADSQTTPTPSLNLGHGQSDLNMTGVKLVMKTDVKEPPYFRGDGTDKHTVHEWEEIMSVYLNKRGVSSQEQSQEIMSRLMGKARDIVKVTLRSMPSLRPAEDSKLVFDILKQHFSEVTYSSMPLADFYNTLPLAGESPMDYWIRLNKAVDVADECLRRQGRNIEDPSHEVTMMLVKHCPDPALASVLKCKTAEKWTANEIQEHLIEHQREARTMSQAKSYRPKNIGAHAQTSAIETVTANNTTDLTCYSKAMEPPSSSQTESVCIQSLIGLLNRVLEQKAQTAAVVPPNRSPVAIVQSRCRVCQSAEHSTTAHCRQANLCMGCYKPGHWKRECQQRQPRINTQPQLARAQPKHEQGGAGLN